MFIFIQKPDNGDFDEITSNLKQACKWYKELKDYVGQADCYVFLAKACFRWEHFSDAMASVKVCNNYVS